MTGTYNIEAIIGDTFIQRFRFVNKDDYMILYTTEPVVKIMSGGNVISELSLHNTGENHLKIVNDDILVWQMSADYTNTFDSGTYQYDLVFLFGANKITLVSGDLTFTQIEP